MKNSNIVITSLAVVILMIGIFASGDVSKEEPQLAKDILWKEISLMKNGTQGGIVIPTNFLDVVIGTRSYLESYGFYGMTYNTHGIMNGYEIGLVYDYPHDTLVDDYMFMEGSINYNTNYKNMMVQTFSHEYLHELWMSNTDMRQQIIDMMGFEFNAGAGNLTNYQKYIDEISEADFGNMGYPLYGAINLEQNVVNNEHYSYYDWADEFFVRIGSTCINDWYLDKVDTENNVYVRLNTEFSICNDYDFESLVPYVNQYFQDFSSSHRIYEMQKIQEGTN